MTRPPEPEFLIQWREWRREGPPKCCHTCDYYSKAGHCESFDMTPPDDFANEVDVCDQWIEEFPF